MKKFNRRPAGFTLVEVLIVVVIMAILAATIVPQFSNSTNDAKVSSAKFNLHTLRSQIELYKSQHNGALPSVTLTELVNQTNATGTVGTGTTFPYGPYMSSIPQNTVTNTNTVVTQSGTPTGTGTGTNGWLYDPTTGKIWFNDTTGTIYPFSQQ
jgi:prepilin-type N-terminal cleavage/methylation domain-containing protein